MLVSSIRKSPPIALTSNSIIEAVHKTVGQVIRTLVALRPPQTEDAAQKLVEEALATAMHATRCAANSSLGNYSPDSLVFNRNMFLDIPVIADIMTLQQNRQAKIDLRLMRENNKRFRHKFKVGEKVYIHNKQNKKNKKKTGRTEKNKLLHHIHVHHALLFSKTKAAKYNNFPLLLIRIYM